ncbi:MAG: cell division protein FtsA [Parcubacteria group bacterium]|nr:cell division protein FtsA [Candidatus Liptonbacteria bacterium]MBI3074917.1 cell division protein FtsA [Parcubacteria group bacterium]
MSHTTTAGIDIGSHTVRIVIAREREGGAGMEILGTGSAESRGIRNGYIAHVNEATRSIKEALARAEKAAGMPVRRALVSLGGISLESALSSGSVMISRIDGKVTDADILRVMEVAGANINFNNRKIIHSFPVRFRLDNKDVLGRPRGMQGVKFEVKMLFVTALSQHLDDLIAAVENAGVDVEDIVASPLAASVVTLSKAQRTAGCVLANIGAETVSIAVFEDDQLVSLEVFPIGSTHITNDIALGLKIPLEEAEALKTGVARTASIGFSQKRFDEIVEARLRDIFDLVQTHLKKIGRNGLLPAGIVFTGGGISGEPLEEIARSALALPARVATLRGAAPSPRNAKTSTEERGSSLPTAWSVAYGLCLLGSGGYTSDFFEFNRATNKIHTHVFKALDWLKQFMP